MNTVKIYGKTVNTWKVFDPEKNREVITQYEIEFTEYRLDGSIYRTGTEDFSAERYKTVLKSQFLWTWDGEARNKGGHRCFQYEGLIKFVETQRKALKQLLMAQYPNASMIQLRNW